MGLWSLARWILYTFLLLFIVGSLLLTWSVGWDVNAAVEKAGRLWGDYAKIVDRIYDLVDRAARFIVPIATIGGAVYGVYHKWQYGKYRMHIHIRDFLKRNDGRLVPTGKKLATVIERPGPDREFAPPIFRIKDLEPALKNMRWGKLEAADKALTAELGKLKQQLEQWGNLEANYNRSRAQGHLVKGAIAASRAANSAGKLDDHRKDDVEAFEHFKAAYELDKNDVEALEYMAHQRVRLGDHNNALTDFENLQQLAEQQQNPLLTSRACKYQATIREHEGAMRLLQNPNIRTDQEPNFQEARNLLTIALETLPDNERGDLEEAEVFELRGRVNKKRQTFRLATDDFTAAERLYDQIAKTTQDNDKRADANAGIDRVRKALEEIRLRPLPFNNGGGNGGGVALPSENGGQTPKR